MHHNDYLNNPANNSFFINPTTAEEVQTIISSLQNNKTNGPFSIPNKILKQFKEVLVIPLCKIINLTFEQGELPLSLKIAKVIPIHKKDQKQIATTTDQYLYFQTLAK